MVDRQDVMSKILSIIDENKELLPSGVYLELCDAIKYAYDNPDITIIKEVGIRRIKTFVDEEPCKWPDDLRCKAYARAYRRCRNFGHSSGYCGTHKRWMRNN